MISLRWIIKSSVFGEELYWNWSKIQQKVFWKIIWKSKIKRVNKSSLFKSKNDQTKESSRILLRICFILFSVNSDYYIKRDRLKTLLLKLSFVFKDDKADENIVILGLFCIRIILLKMNSDILNNFFGFLWSPIIFLIEKLINQDSFNKNRTKVYLAALKVLELMSFKDIKIFNLTKWAFFFDCNLKRLWS